MTEHSSPLALDHSAPGIDCQGDAPPTANEAHSGTYLIHSIESSDPEASRERLSGTLDMLSITRAMVMGIAHEISSPLAALLINVSLARGEAGKRRGKTAEASSGGLEAFAAQVYEDLGDALAMAERLKDCALKLRQLAGDADCCEEVSLQAALNTARTVAQNLNPPVRLACDIDPSLSMQGNHLDVVCVVLSIVRHLSSDPRLDGTEVAASVSVDTECLTVSLSCRAIAELTSASELTLSPCASLRVIAGLVGQMNGEFGEVTGSERERTLYFSLSLAAK